MTKVIDSRIKLRFRLSQNNSNSARILASYSDAFRSLQAELTSIRKSAHDYKDLPNIRRILTNTEDHVRLLVDSNLPDIRVRQLIDILPMYKMLHIDAKSFLLLNMGFRSSMVINNSSYST